MSVLPIIIGIVTAIISLVSVYIAFKKFQSDTGINAAEWFIVEQARVKIPDREYSSYFISIMFINRRANISTNITIPFSQKPIFINIKPEVDFSLSENDNKYKLKFSVPPMKNISLTMLTDETIISVTPISDNSDLRSAWFKKLSDREISENEARKFWLGGAIGFVNGISIGIWARLLGII